MDLLDDQNPIVRFWGAFGLGKLKTRTALPLLQALTSDSGYRRHRQRRGSQNPPRAEDSV
jgi:hypothetical protein